MRSPNVNIFVLIFAGYFQRYIMRNLLHKPRKSTLTTKYCMSKKYLPILYKRLLHKMGNYFLDIKYSLF